MSDIHEESSQPILPVAHDSKAQSAELTDDDKSLLAAFQEDLKAEQEMLNRLFGDQVGWH